MRPVDEALLEHMRFMADALKGMTRGRQDFKYSSIPALLLEEGFLGKAEPYTQQEEALILEVLRQSGCRPKMKQCYYNAQSLGTTSDLPYVEGYAHPEGLIAIEHGWNVLPSGKVVDLTLRPMGEKETADPKKLLERAKENLSRHAYLGVEFPADIVSKTWLRTGAAVNLLEDRDVQEIVFKQGYPAKWRTVTKGSSLGARSPEEEWLNQPEREGFPADETRSPFEGDIPPWGQRGYEGVFPMARKIFYVTAYLLLGPEKLSRSPAPVQSPVLGDAFHVANVGNVPAGEFGSELMYEPFAAIPVRYEDREETTPLVDYLSALISELGVYGKILLEESFPQGNEVRLVGGRWFPVRQETRDYGGIDFLNAYNTNRFYGGPHEGGWWYDAGDPVASVPIRSEDPATRLEWDAYLRDKVAWTSEHDTGSVLGHDVFDLRLEDFFAKPFPEETPRYE